MLDLLLAAAEAATPAPGDLATYVLGTTPHCVRVGPIDTGIDDRPWAWIVGERQPRWAIRVPVRDLTPGCVDRAQEARR